MGGSCYDLRVMTTVDLLPATTRNHKSRQGISNFGAQEMMIAKETRLWCMGVDGSG
ncbi:hypothetical protein WN944_024017 [Citrus x changshan-huyou]|uniref:Uncharacterized protein n=1 Tax=Citrus x changshan-huyou TaxID=2935761 RepID=A0AAP0LQK7_9ROSI